ncbi:MAG: hypothetical protein HY705_02575 [Gemmatimonadetes bacterium]|nr:hypothetical protein [Gemmatimonadota bacterium]
MIAEFRAAPRAARQDRDKARTLLHFTLPPDIRNRAIELGHAVSDAEVSSTFLHR